VPRLEARTVVYREPAAVFDTLLDLRRYESYSEYLVRVIRNGDGEDGTEYRLRFEWGPVGYTVRSRVTAVDRPERLDFEVTKGIRAAGSWHVDPADEPAPDAVEEPATEVRFVVEYDPDSVAGGAVSLPAFTPLSWVLERVAPLVEREAERVVERVVADLEGQARSVDLQVDIR